MDKPGKWYFEVITPNLVMLHSIKGVVHTSKTSHQEVEILESVPFGRCLVLDGKTQSSEADEHLYHEALVHPAMLLHPGPESVFIGGGGEGATLREVLKYESVRRVVMLDIDEEVIDLCRRFLPNHHQGAFDDPRLELHIQDAREFLSSTSQSFDVVILDLADPIEGGPAYKLYTQDFYRLIKKRISSGGLLVTQSGPAGPNNYGECFTAVVKTLSTLFPHVYPYSSYIPCFGTPWGFTLASDRELPAISPPAFIDDLLEKRLRQPLRYYDGITHQHLFSLPRYLREGQEKETRIIRDSQPIFMP